MRRSLAALALSLACGVAGLSGARAEPPLPPPRPEEPVTPDKPAPPPAVPEATPSDSTAQAKEPDSCVERLRQAGFKVEPAEEPQSANGICRIDIPVRLIAVPSPSEPEAAVELKERPVLACAFAESLGRWIGDLVAPALRGQLGQRLLAVHTGPGYVCRNRNGAPQGKISAHAQGIALDISHFALSDGTNLRIKPDGDERHQAAIASIRKAACGWFTTILGPGTDPAHAEHLHVDILKHGSSDLYRICQ